MDLNIQNMIIRIMNSINKYIPDYWGIKYAYDIKFNGR
jgi:hypothetical protein